jgi:hypothetical protein
MNNKQGATRYIQIIISRPHSFLLMEMLAALTLASSNVSRSVFSDSPDIPETTDGADMLMNGTPNSY